MTILDKMLENCKITVFNLLKILKKLLAPKT